MIKVISDDLTALEDILGTRQR